MIVQFTVGNYRSIREPVTLSLVSGSNNDKHVIQARNIRLVPSAVVYGANASGKSNLLKALAFMRSLVLNETKVVQSTDELPYDPFRLSTDTENAAGMFEIVFITNDSKYRYGFEADGTSVQTEWLFEDKRGREALLFSRDRAGDELYVNPERFREGKGLKVLGNSLFLWKCDQNGGSVSRRVLAWFKNLNIVSGMHSSGYVRYTVEQMEKAEFRDSIMRLVHVADLGIQDITVEKKPVPHEELSDLNLPEFVRSELSAGTSPLVRLNIKALHKKFDSANKYAGTVSFELGVDESEGTKKYFSLSAPILDTLRNGKIIIVDELDASLHPMLVANLVSLFHDPNVNSQNAQLIFATHDTNLLNQSLFHKSQIWFTEKDTLGSTRLTSLLEYRGVRREDNIEKHYIQGKYGAIPFLGDFVQAVQAGTHGSNEYSNPQSKEASGGVPGKGVITS